MTPKKRKSVHTIVFAIALIGSAVRCGDGNGAANSEACEGRCVKAYRTDIDECEEKTSGCMESCKSVDDTSCMWDCEEHETDCQFDLIMCVADCPCVKEQLTCINECDVADIDCTMDCGMAYQECAGADSPYLCASLCGAQKSSCVFDCENSASSMSDYITCRESCHADLSDCVGDCY